MKEFVITILGLLVVLCFGAQWIATRTVGALKASHDPQFRKFQNIFLFPYLLALFSDWLQGPYVYRLYSQYGYAPKQIAVLYIVGFGASVFGTFTGPLADRFGRKRLCLAFCLTYSFCCLTKVSPNFWWLFTGRVLGGVSTSILFSTFEAWYVCQHTEKNYPADWISSTFSMSTFWNGVLAIAAGIVADIGADWMHWGPVSPFLMAIPFLLFSGAMISMSWTENYGSRQFDLGRSLFEGLRVIFTHPTILLLGIVQSMFESIMYIFVFLWTPVLDASPEADGRWPLGLVFSCFMVCIMIGSSANTLLLNRNVRPPVILMVAVGCSSISMITCSWSSVSNHLHPMISFMAFLVLEVAVGMYFPAIGYLRSQVIPESLRANIMNWFRVPLNVITCSVLYWLHRNDDTVGGATTRNDENAFLFNIGLSLVGMIAVVIFKQKFVEKSDVQSEKSDAAMVANEEGLNRGPTSDDDTVKKPLA